MRRRQFLSTPSLALAANRRPAVRFPAPWTSAYRVDPSYPHQLMNQQGDHLFVLNKTAWAYFGCKQPESFLQRTRSQGANVLRVALEGTPYFKELGIDLWPWGGTRQKPEWPKFNDDYWQTVESRVRMAGEAGIGLDIVLYFTLRPETVDLQRPYWTRILERLSPYANILAWEIANEYVRNEALQDAAGDFLSRNDPYRRPVCTSNGTSDDAIWPDKPWMGLAVVHTCTGSDWPLREWYQSVARNARGHGKPVFNNETGREKRHRNDDPVHRRKQSWTWCCSGGFWTWHSREGCEAIDDPKYRAAGGEFLKPLKDFFERLPFWRMDPNFTVVRPQEEAVITSTLAEPDRKSTMSYLCTEKSGDTIDESRAAVRLPAGAYMASARNPVTLEVVSRHKFESAGFGKHVEIPLPEFTDDLLLYIEQTRAGLPNRIKGAG